MKYVLDSHSHTIVSGHAYNTMTEMMQAAAHKHLELFCITDHAPAMPGSTHPFYFANSTILDREYYRNKFGGGTQFLFGVELNILDGGALDLPDSILAQLDVIIASMHIPCISSGGSDSNTQAYLNAMKNPYLHIIGHPDDNRYPVDLKALVKGAKQYGKILELNNHSLDPGCNRSGNSAAIDLELLALCKEFRQPIVVGSDAHIETEVGRHDYAYHLLSQTNFPEELVLNSSSKRFLTFLDTIRRSAEAAAT